MRCRECELLEKLEKYRDVVSQLQYQRNYLLKCMDSYLSQALKPGIDALDSAIKELEL